jgi:NAD(P)-dependent dehydrogenase (short-subunit alcohol dehydrogenase family)
MVAAADVTDPAAVDRMVADGVAAFGIDIWSTTPRSGRALLLQMSLEHWREMSASFSTARFAPRPACH